MYLPWTAVTLQKLGHVLQKLHQEHLKKQKQIQRRRDEPKQWQWNVQPILDHLSPQGTLPKTDSQWEFAIRGSKLSLVLCGNLAGWDGLAGGLRREATYVYLWLTHVDVWQKPTLNCKPIIL